MKLQNVVQGRMHIEFGITMKQKDYYLFAAEGGK